MESASQLLEWRRKRVTATTWDAIELACKRRTREIAFNEVNELQSESDGGRTLVKGSVDEAAVVNVDGN